MKKSIFKLIVLCLLLSVNHIHAQQFSRIIRTAEYKALQERLCRGWNTWYNNSLTSYVHLPEGFVVNLCIATDDNRHYLKDVLKAADIAARPERVFPSLRADDGSYTSNGRSIKFDGCKMSLA